MSRLIYAPIAHPQNSHLIQRRFQPPPNPARLSRVSARTIFQNEFLFVTYYYPLHELISNKMKANLTLDFCY